MFLFLEPNTHVAVGTPDAVAPKRQFEPSPQPGPSQIRTSPANRKYSSRIIYNSRYMKSNTPSVVDNGKFLLFIYSHRQIKRQNTWLP